MITVKVTQEDIDEARRITDPGYEVFASTSQFCPVAIAARRIFGDALSFVSASSIWVGSYCYRLPPEVMLFIEQFDTECENIEPITFDLPERTRK